MEFLFRSKGPSTFVIFVNMNRTRFTMVLAMVLAVGLSKLVAQRDTLRLFYQGVKTEVADSNIAKLAQWASKLPKDRKTNIDIVAYYDNGDFKKFMVERAENVFLQVNRKARDLVQINKTEAIRGKKNQRYQVDIIFDTNAPAAAPVAQPVAEPAKAAVTEPRKEEKKDEPKKSEPKATKKEAPEKKEVVAEPKKEEKKQNEKAEPKSDKYDYVTDSTYVNGVLKVTTRKIKKK